MSITLEAQHVVATFATRDGTARAVDDVSMSFLAGETTCIIGESGSGKTTFALSLLGLVPARSHASVSGRVLFEGEDLLAIPKRRLEQIRGRRIAVIFQDPMTALNPIRRIGDQFLELLDIHHLGSETMRRALALDMLARVGIREPALVAQRYPHQLSGGMLQRVLIAMAVSTDPAVIIADEPTSALDVTIQAQILELLVDLQMERGLSLLLITHDIGVAAQVSDQVNVMYAGRIVERGSASTVLAAPRMPYTMGLIESIPNPARIGQKLSVIPGQPPSITHLPPGCSFAPRCPFRFDRCYEERPLLRGALDGRLFACHLDEPVTWNGAAAIRQESQVAL